MITVNASYTFMGNFNMDNIAEKVVGRPSDFSGVGEMRDLGWNCKSEFEAIRIKKALDKIGMIAKIEV